MTRSHRILVPLILVLLAPFLTGANIAGLLGGGVPVAASGITQDAMTSNKQTTGNPSFNHAQGSVTNGCATVIVTGNFNAATAITSVTYGGSGMGAAVASVTHTGGFYHAAIYKLDLGTSASGTKAIAVTFNGTVYNSMVTVVTHNGVKQATTFTSATTDLAYGAGPVTRSITTTATSELVVGGALASGGAVTTSQTQYDAYTVSQGHGSAYTAGTGGSVTMSWTVAGSGNSVAVAEVLQAAP